MRGRSAKTYIDTAGNWTAPTWVEVAGIIDETITPSIELASGGSRAEEYIDNDVASRNFEWTCTYRYKAVCEDPVFPELLAAFVAGDPLYMAFMDGSILVAGNRGWRSPILISQMPEQRNLGDLVEISVTGVGKLVCDGSTLRKPTAYVVPGSAPGTTTTPST